MAKKHKLSKAVLDLLPDEVPIPSAEQFITGKNCEPGVGCCLEGWCSRVLFGDPWMTKTTIEEDRLSRRLARFVSEDANPIRWNDKRTTAAQRARRWESKMRKLGYRIVESK